MTFQELMMKSLTDLLEEEEILKYPIYATLMQRGKHWLSRYSFMIMNQEVLSRQNIWIFLNIW